MVEPQQQQQQQQRRVQFCDGERLYTIVCELPNREDFTPDDHAALWFSKTEYQFSRTEAKMISRDAARCGFGKNLDGTFVEKCSTAQELLQLWCASGDGRRGLERWANHAHGEVRNEEQFQAIQMIIEAQETMMASSTSVDYEKLRKVSHKATKTARHFARMMGKADSYAVAQQMEAANNNKKSDGCETIATENTTVISALEPRRRGSDASSCYGGGGGADSVYSSSTFGTAISNPRIPLIADEKDLKDCTSREQQQRPRFRRFGFGARQNSKRDKAENTSTASAARVSRIA